MIIILYSYHCCTVQLSSSNHHSTPKVCVCTKSVDVCIKKSPCNNLRIFFLFFNAQDRWKRKRRKIATTLQHPVGIQLIQLECLQICIAHITISLVEIHTLTSRDRHEGSSLQCDWKSEIRHTKMFLLLLYIVHCYVKWIVMCYFLLKSPESTASTKVFILYNVLSPGK